MENVYLERSVFCFFKNQSTIQHYEKTILRKGGHELSMWILRTGFQGAEPKAGAVCSACNGFDWRSQIGTALMLMDWRWPSSPFCWSDFKYQNYENTRRMEREVVLDKAGRRICRTSARFPSILLRRPRALGPRFDPIGLSVAPLWNTWPLDDITLLGTERLSDLTSTAAWSIETMTCRLVSYC